MVETRLIDLRGFHLFETFSFSFGAKQHIEGRETVVSLHTCRKNELIKCSGESDNGNLSATKIKL